MHGLETRIDEILSALTGVDDSVEQLKARAEAASLALKQAEAAASTLKIQEPKLTATETALSQAEATAKDAATLAANALTRQQQLDAVLKERQADVPADLADVEKLRAAQTAAARSLDALKRAFARRIRCSRAMPSPKLTRVKALMQASAESTIRLQEQRAAKSADLAQRLLAAGFDGNAEFRAASLGEQQMAVMQAAIKTFDTNLAAAMQRHERAGNDTRELVRPDIAGITVQHDGAKAAHLAASNAVRDAIAAHDGTKSPRGGAAQLAGEFQALQARYAVVKKVADVATGNNAQRMSFQRYVLATLLEEVLVATTLRLQGDEPRALRDAPQAPARRSAVRSRAGPGGLRSLHRHDPRRQHPVGRRDFPRFTGAGLGLSDVVQSYAGGIRLDAIFVDEGFGTPGPRSAGFRHTGPEGPAAGRSHGGDHFPRRRVARVDRCTARVEGRAVGQRGGVRRLKADPWLTSGPSPICHRWQAQHDPPLHPPQPDPQGKARVLLQRRADHERRRVRRARRRVAASRAR